MGVRTNATSGVRVGMSLRAAARAGTARMVTTGATGKCGARGQDGGVLLTRTPSVVLSGHRVVKAVGLVDAAYPDLANAGDAELLLGVTLGASSPPDLASIQAAGEMDEPSWSWALGPVWCGPAGQLVQTLPVGALWTRQVAVATAPTRLTIQLRPPIMTPEGSR